MRTALFATLSLVACGSRVELPMPTTTTDSAVVDGALAVDSGPVECVDSMGRMPASMRVCNVDTDCEVRPRQVDCCGSIVLVGVRSNVAPAFAVCEAERQKGLPMCDCLAQPTKTDEGSTIPPDASVGARCTASACTSFVR